MEQSNANEPLLQSDTSIQARASPRSIPWGPMMALLTSVVSVALSETVLYPFVAFMVGSFHLTDDPTKIGYYAGYLASAFYLGGLITSPVWGAVSDRIGRKPVLIAGIFANTICAVAFGFSTTFTMAMTARFINGLFMGIMPVCRSTIPELCDSSTQARGFALVGGCWGIGFLIGPALGGLMAEPANKYPSIFPPGSLFDRYPYSPPCLLLSLISFTALLCILFFLPETRGRARAVVHDTTRVEVKGDGEGGKGVEAKEGEVAKVSDSADMRKVAQVKKVGEEKEEEKVPSAFRLFFLLPTFISALIYALLGFTTTSQNEVFTLWGITDTALGGLGFGSDYIGFAQASSGIALVPFQLFFYSKVEAYLGPLRTLKVMLVGLVVMTFIPIIGVFESAEMRLFACVWFMVVRGIAVTCSFTSAVICLTNSIEYPQYLGTIQGMCQTLTMSFEAAAPTLGATIYAWSISGHHVFPFDYRLYWVLWGILCCVMFGLANILPSDVNRRKFITQDVID